MSEVLEYTSLSSWDHSVLIEEVSSFSGVLLCESVWLGIIGSTLIKEVSSLWGHDPTQCLRLKRCPYLQSVNCVLCSMKKHKCNVDLHTPCMNSVIPHYVGSWLVFMFHTIKGMPSNCVSFSVRYWLTLLLIIIPIPCAHVSPEIGIPWTIALGSHIVKYHWLILLTARHFQSRCLTHIPLPVAVESLYYYLKHSF